jgi:hypothetical protein
VSVLAKSNKVTKSPVFLAALILIWTLLRNGIRVQGPGELGLTALKYFPEAKYYVSESFGPLLIGKLFNLNSEYKWSISYLIATLVFIYIVNLWVLKEFKAKGFLILALFSISPYAINLLIAIGHYDLFTLVGWTIYSYAVYRKHDKLRKFALFLAISGNPEQAFLSSIGLFLLSLKTKKLNEKSIFKTDLIISLIIFLMVQIWLINFGAGGRVLLVILFLVKSTTFFVQTFPNSLTSLYGIFWPLVIFYILKSTNNRLRFINLISLIVIPFFATIVAVDGTRIFACISLPLILNILSDSDINKFFDWILTKRLYLNLAIGLCLLFPFSFISVGQPYEPYLKFQTKFSQIENQYTLSINNIKKIMKNYTSNWPIADRFWKHY